MKLTKARLRQIIKEELGTLREVAGSKKQAAVKQLQGLVKAGLLSQDEFDQKKAALLGQKKDPQTSGGLQDGGTLVGPVDPPQDPSAGGTTLVPADKQPTAAGNKKLALVAKELQILLNKIKQEL